MKILSGNVTTYVPFLAIEETAPFIARLTGLTGFSAFRARNGAASVAMDSPTVVEDANIPGLYWLLADEDTTLDTGFIEQQMVFHIECATMHPVSTTVTLSQIGNLLPDSLDDGFMKVAIKKVGLTLLTPGGGGGQKYGG